MSDLGDRLGAYIDAAAPAISMEEIQAAVTATPDEERRGSRWRAVVAVAAATALLIGVIVAFRGARVDEQLAAGPGTTAPATEDLSWLTPLGAELPAPAVPAGWKVLDFQDMRFAVPADWATPVSGTCLRAAAPGAVIIRREAPETVCTPAQPPPPSQLIIEPASGSPSQGDVMIGTLPAEALDAPKVCPACTGHFRLRNGSQVSALGPDGGRVLATFTDSGRQRALQSGPFRDASTWNEVAFGGVTVDVPPTWSTLDLAASFTQTTGPDGSVIQASGHANPGICGPALFPVNGNATAFVGVAPTTPSCPPGVEKALEPTDGAWIRTLDDADPNTTSVTRGRVHGLDVDIRSLDATRDRSAAPLELDVHVGARTQRLTIGVGLDASVARTIVRSIRPAGTPRDPTSVVALSSPTPPSTSTPTTAATATQGTVAPGAERFCSALRDYVRDFGGVAVGGSAETPADAARRIDEARVRLHEIADLAPPGDAAYWSGLAARPDIAPTAADDPALFSSIDESVAWRCGASVTRHEGSPPGTTPSSAGTIPNPGN